MCRIRKGQVSALIESVHVQDRMSIHTVSARPEKTSCLDGHNEARGDVGDSDG